MNIKNFWMVLAVALVSLCAVSCGDDDDKGGTQENPTTSADPEGTIVANITNDEHWVKLSGDNFCASLYMNSANNFKIGDYDCQVVCVGNVKSLSSIKKVPETGWSDEVAVLPGYGYIIREYHYYDHEYTYTYARLYVVSLMESTSGGIMGCTFKYQVWNPESK